MYRREIIALEYFWCVVVINFLICFEISIKEIQLEALALILFVNEGEHIFHERKKFLIMQ
jgi:hypothetical protein